MFLLQLHKKSFSSFAGSSICSKQHDYNLCLHQFRLWWPISTWTFVENYSCSFPRWRVIPKSLRLASAGLLTKRLLLLLNQCFQTTSVHVTSHSHSFFLCSVSTQWCDAPAIYYAACFVNELVEMGCKKVAGLLVENCVIIPKRYVFNSVGKLLPNKLNFLKRASSINAKSFGLPYRSLCTLMVSTTASLGLQKFRPFSKQYARALSSALT